MATNNLTGENIVLPIYNQDGTPFNGLVLKKSVYESVVMSLGDKITGDVYYPNNALVVTMGEYVEYNGVRYVLVNPPTIVREGMISDNGELKGMTKYSFTFYHPMYMLGNFPFCDVAVSVDQQRYLSENKTFAWIGNLVDYVAKINKNLESTEWYCVISDNVQTIDRNKLSEVESFDKNTIAEALKRGYEIWEIPYIISTIASTDPLYAQGKRYLIQYGLPTTEILVENEQHELVPFVFHFGQGVGLKNNSRTPRNNKIVTRIAGYGSEDNIPYGYPQIPYEGGTCQYPLYYGIVGGQRVQLIKHPFTRTHLMPPIYRETVNKKVNPMAVGYDPTIEIKDYYDADNTYENPIKPEEPSYEIHEFEKIKPEFGDNSILGVVPVSNDVVEQKYSTMSSFLTKLRHYMQQTNIDIERHVLNVLYDKVQLHVDDEDGRTDAKQYYFHYKIEVSGDYEKVVYESSNINFEETILLAVAPPAPAWDDEMDDDGNYKQSYFKITIPQLSFDVYASAAVTQEMTVNMRSGACLGCSFPVMVDWDDYKRNFFDEDGNFAPNGTQRDLEKYPNSQSGQIELTLQKETNTFGTLMPNIYQKPAAGDKFVFLGISMPTSYITAAESRLETDMKQYMRDNNVHYFDYPLKFDEKFMVDNIGILNQMQNNVVVRFDYAGEIHALYIKQISVKYENKPLPTYDITLTDDIEIVLNPIGQVTDDVSKLRLALGGGGVGGSISGDYIRKDIDDTAYGLIRLIKGMQVGERFVTGLLGEGGMFRKESDGTTYLECDKLYVRMRAYFDTVEIRKYIHSGGNRIASLAGIKCSRVEYIDANGNVTNDASEATKFRCFFRANNDGQEVTNDFVVGDLAFCKETNASEAQGVEQHGYWRAVVGRNAQGVLTSDGEGWIDLSATDCLSGSDVPIAQDDIIQLGNKTDTTRQGAIIEFVGGADAPSYQIYQGINDYSLNGKNYIGLGYNSSTGRAYLNVYGDAYLGDPNESTYIKYNAGTKNLEIKAKISAESTIDGETLAQFISENTWTEEQIDALITAETDPLVDAIEEIQKQVDGAIETWFYDGVPTLQNLPASEWDTADEKNKHLGDLYYDNLTGYGYRFKYDELNRQWLWGRITDVDVVKALADAAKAQDTADHKRRVFVVQPTPPYDAGDLWVNATYPTGNTETNEQQSKYCNDVLRCNTSKAEGTTFAIADWSLASKYTDDKALNDFKANQYVTALTNGTISTNINNAQQAAAAAQQAADDAQDDADAAATAAANAQTSATNANNRLDGWADDGKISPTEKTSLKLEWENVKKEYTQICNDADKYSVSKTAFASAYTSANSAFQKYTAATPENITIGTDYANIAAYYAARQTILDDITTAAKKVATDAQAKADSAYALAGSAEAAAQAAEAHAATLDYVKTALKQDTVIDGGLVLSTLIALRDGSNHIWSGISGTYQSAETGTGYKGHGIAAWYGGAMVDKEVTTTATDYAKSLFRFDGSGYVAGGNLSWDKNGNVTIQGYSINATTLQVGGSNVATQAALANYVTIGTAQTITGAKTFGTTNGSYIQIGAIRIVYDQSNNALKIVGSDGSSSANLYATGGVSALGQSSSGGGGIDMAAVWTALGNATNEQINASHLSTALSAYNPTSNFKTINGNSIIGTGNIEVGAAGDYLPLSGGTVTGYINYKVNFDLSKSDNGVSSTIWPTTFNILDSSNRISARLENVVKTNGENGFFLYARQYDANGNMTKQEGLQYNLPKTGDGVWTINNPSSFRTALGLGARATDNTDYLPLTGGTITGAVATNGGIMPLDAGNVNTRTGNGKIFFKNAHRTGDDTPHNGLVIEYGEYDKWGGQLLFTDTNNQGLYWNGWSNGVRGEWKKIAFSSDLSSYLPLSGGTMSNTNLITNLNADLLDGHDSTYFANLGTTWDKTVRQDGYILELRAGTQSTSDNPFNIIGGNAATVIQNLPENTMYGAQLAFGFGSARVVYRNRNNNSSNSDWVGIIAGSADKLVTSRTIWGQSFDGTANISGNISSVGNIIGTAGINMITTGDSSEFRVKLNNVDAASYAFTKTFFGCFGAGAGKLDLGRDIARWNVLYTININASGNSSIGGTLGVSGATTLSSTLGVSGLITASGGITIPSGKTLTIGDAVLSWDSTNQGIKITKGLYSETFISALGAGSGGSGGVDMNAVWTALGNNTNEQINASHLSTALNGYATQSWVESQGYTKTSGTVTAVKVGSTTYNPSSGVISLPAYPTKASWNYDDVYLKLSGGTVTGDLDSKRNFDLSKSDNGVSSTMWPTTFNILDSSNRISARLENIVKANGENGFYLYARQYDANGNMTKQEGLLYTLPKTGDGVWTIHNPSSFRTALGLGARATDNTDYLPLTGGTLTGAVALNGGLTPLGTGTVGTASGGSKVWFKRVNSSEAPNNGVVIEFGNVISWTGQLYLGDNATQGLYWNGWSNGVRGEWKKIAFSSDLSSYLPLSGGTMSNTNLVTNLNADLLDGHDSTYFANLGTTWDKTVRQDGYILELRAGTQSTSDNPFNIIGGNAATVIQNLPENTMYGAQLAFGFGSARVVYRNRNNNSSNSDWVGIIAGSADKLVTARTLWGQSFDGSSNVDGKLTINSNLKGSDGCADYQAIYSEYTSSIGYSFGLKNVYNVAQTGYGVGLKLSLGTSGETQKWFGIAAVSTGAYSNQMALTFNFNSTERVRITSDGDVGIGTSSPSYKLHVSGTFYASGNSSVGGTLGVTGAITATGGVIGNASSATKLETSRTIWGQSFDGTANVSGAISGATTISASSNVSVGGTLSVTSATTLSSTLGVTGATTLSSTLGVSGATTMSGKLTMNKTNIELVNTSTNDGIWVEMKGVSYDWGIATGSGNVNRGIIDFGGAGWMLYFDASNTYCEYGNFICSGGVTALSDIRHKSIVDSTKISVEQIARMRSVKFLWNDGRNDDAIHVGSIAQDWQSILPEVVIRKDDKDGTLSLNYGVAALVSVITTARKVVDHERRIKELEKENERLRFEVEQLKIA